MPELLIGLLLGIAVAAFVALKLRKRNGDSTDVQVFSTVEEMRSIGELSVFKLLTKEIVTARDHSFGEVGKRYFEWVVSSRKMAMIISFDIDFRYDLRSKDFKVETQDDGRIHVTMPPCLYETHIKDVHFYDEQNSKLMPWLLPDLINGVFGAGFNEDTKNRLIAEAKREASSKAGELVDQLRSEVQRSARQTVELLAKGFGVEASDIDFSDSKPVQGKIEYLDPSTEVASAQGAA